MKVTIIGPAYPLRGGIAHHVYWLQRHLRARGHTVQVISFRQLYPSLLFPGTTELDTSQLKLDADAQSLLTSLNPATWRKAIRAVREFAPDVVVFQWWQPFFGLLVGTLARAFKKAGFQQIVECHNILPHEGSPLDRQLLRFAFAPIDRFITHSAIDAAKLAALAQGKRITVSPLPSLDEFAGTQRAARDGRRILFFGKVRKYKGLGVLLEAMPHVLSQIACELSIVGEFYDSVDKYQRQISALGIEKNVRLTNRYVPNEEVPSIFAQADVLVLPYVSASQSGVLRIAFANALPVIASTAGGLAEAVQENLNGLLCPPRDVRALADKIVHYFTANLGPIFAENLRAGLQDEARCTIIDAIEAAAPIESINPQRSVARSETHKQLKIKN